MRLLLLLLSCAICTQSRGFDLLNTNVDSAGVSFAFSNSSGLVMAQSLWSNLTTCPFVSFGSEAFYTYGCELSMEVIEQLQAIPTFAFVSDKSFPESSAGLLNAFLLANTTPLRLFYPSKSDCENDLKMIASDSDCKFLDSNCLFNNITLTCNGGLTCSGCVLNDFDKLQFQKAQFQLNQ
jgi:hypothetical protein